MPCRFFFDSPRAACTPSATARPTIPAALVVAPAAVFAAFVAPLTTWLMALENTAAFASACAASLRSNRYWPASSSAWRRTFGSSFSSAVRCASASGEPSFASCSILRNTKSMRLGSFWAIQSCSAGPDTSGGGTELRV